MAHSAPGSGVRRDALQIVEGVDSSVVSVSPEELDRISAHGDEVFQGECRRGQRLWRCFVNVSQDVGLALAACTGATAAELFKRDETLRPILPFEGQFVSDVLNVCGAHGRRLMQVRDPEQTPSSRRAVIGTAVPRRVRRDPRHRSGSHGRQPPQSRRTWKSTHNQSAWRDGSPGTSSLVPRPPFPRRR